MFMNCDDVKLGNLVSLKFSNEFKSIKLGIVTDLKKDSFMVKWIWYNKLFFMDNEHQMFNELNREYLLTETCYNKKECLDSLQTVSGNL